MKNTPGHQNAKAAEANDFGQIGTETKKKTKILVRAMLIGSRIVLVVLLFAYITPLGQLTTITERDMAMADMKKILEKCKKLLAMAKDACNETESATAMRQLQKTLAKYSLSMSEVERCESEIEKDTWRYSASGIWSRRIMADICKLYFCEMIYSKDQKKQVETYMIVGSEINRLVALEMGQNAVKLINKLANKGAKEAGNGKIDYKYRVSFRNGAAARIGERCRELIELAKSGKLEGEDGTTLPALASVYEQQLAIVKDYIDSNMDVKMKRSRPRSTNASGYGAGQSAANKVKLQNTQLKKQQDLLN